MCRGEARKESAVPYNHNIDIRCTLSCINFIAGFVGLAKTYGLTYKIYPMIYNIYIYIYVRVKHSDNLQWQLLQYI